MPAYEPNAPRPFPGDNTPGLPGILAEVKGGLESSDAARRQARDLSDWYAGKSERFLPLRPSEDNLSWLTRPNRVSFITREAVDALTSQLYKPGPRHRKVTGNPKVSAWYGRVARDIQLSALMRHADKYATLHGICMIGIYPTREPARPINYHFYRRQEFEPFTAASDPRIPVAVCTVTCTDRETERYQLWTKTHYYTFYKGKSWGYQPGGWGAARYDLDSSGPHDYGCLPFAFVTHELPTTELTVCGLGESLAKINRALNIDKSNLALWVHHYARPLGFVSGVGPEWRPKFIDGGFVPLVVRHDSTESAPVVPQASYLESSFDIAAVSEYIRSEANQALAELGVPVTIATTSDGGNAANGMSGLAIAAMNADLITYAKGRQGLFEHHESNLCQLICRVAASQGGKLAAALESVSLDVSLRIGWPEVAIDLPGDARDAADGWELDNGLATKTQILMRRQGLDRDEAIEQFREIARLAAIEAEILANPDADVSALIPTPQAEPEPEAPDPDRIAGDMGLDDLIGPDDGATQNAVKPSMSITYAYQPNEPIPASFVGMPGPRGGTES